MNITLMTRHDKWWLRDIVLSEITACHTHEQLCADVTVRLSKWQVASAKQVVGAHLALGDAVVSTVWWSSKLVMAGAQCSLLRDVELNMVCPWVPEYCKVGAGDHLRDVHMEAHEEGMWPDLHQGTRSSSNINSYNVCVCVCWASHRTWWTVAFVRHSSLRNDWLTDASHDPQSILPTLWSKFDTWTVTKFILQLASASTPAVKCLEMVWIRWGDELTQYPPQTRSP